MNAPTLPKRRHGEDPPDAECPIRTRRSAPTLSSAQGRRWAKGFADPTARATSGCQKVWFVPYQARAGHAAWRAVPSRSRWRRTPRGRLFAGQTTGAPEARSSGLAEPPALRRWFRTPKRARSAGLHRSQAHDRLRAAYGRAVEILQQARRKRIGASAGLQVERRLPTTALENQRVMIR